MTQKELDKQLKGRWEGGRGGYYECDQGWFPIISQLDLDIRQLVPDYTIFQIKEKFGGLRFYIGFLQEDVCEEVYNLIQKAERVAAETCECCGEPGVLCRRGGWLKTLCKSCFVDWTKYCDRPSEYGVDLK